MSEKVIYTVEIDGDFEIPKAYTSPKAAYHSLVKLKEAVQNDYEEGEEEIALDTSLDEVVGNAYPVDMKEILIGLYRLGDVIQWYRIKAFILVED